MWLVRLFVKIMFFPILLLIGVAKLVVILEIKIYGFLSFWFWVLLAIIIIMDFLNKQWNQILIMITLGGISIAFLSASVCIQIVLEGLAEWFKKRCN